MSLQGLDTRAHKCTHMHVDPIKNYECGINDVHSYVCQTEIQSLTLIFIMILNKKYHCRAKRISSMPGILINLSYWIIFFQKGIKMKLKIFISYLHMSTNY